MKNSYLILIILSIFSIKCSNSYKYTIRPSVRTLGVPAAVLTTTGSAVGLHIARETIPLGSFFTTSDRAFVSFCGGAIGFSAGVLIGTITYYALVKKNQVENIKNKCYGDKLGEFCYMYGYNFAKDDDKKYVFEDGCKLGNNDSCIALQKIENGTYDYYNKSNNSRSGIDPSVLSALTGGLSAVTGNMQCGTTCNNNYLSCVGRGVSPVSCTATMSSCKLLCSSTAANSPSYPNLTGVNVEVPKVAVPENVTPPIKTNTPSDKCQEIQMNMKAIGFNTTKWYGYAGFLSSSKIFVEQEKSRGSKWSDTAKKLSSQREYWKKYYKEKNDFDRIYSSLSSDLTDKCEKCYDTPTVGYTLDECDSFTSDYEHCIKALSESSEIYYKTQIITDCLSVAEQQLKIDNYCK